MNTHKSLELNPEIKGNKKGGDTGKTTIQDVRQIIGAKLQKSKN